MQYIVNKYKELYQYYIDAALNTDVPPHFIAAIHYRENSMKTNNPEPGGPMQFDPPLNPSFIRKLLKEYTQFDDGIINYHISKGQNNLVTALTLCGCFVQNKLKIHKKQQLNKEMIVKDEKLIMKAFEYYNGTGYGSPLKSPYVSNMLDDDHQNMRIKGTVINKNGTRRKIDVIDRRFGAYTIFKYLDTNFNINWSKHCFILKSDV